MSYFIVEILHRTPHVVDMAIKNILALMAKRCYMNCDGVSFINYNYSRNEEKVYNYLDEHGLTAQSKKEMAEEVGLSYPTILKYVHSYETIKEDLSTTCGTVRFLSLKIMQERELEQVREESR